MPQLSRIRSCHVLALVLATAAGPSWGETPFATRVVSYDPAPGQFVNLAAFNDRSRALGPPHGGGTAAADNSSLVTLGGFGGSITLAFDHTVEDHPLNPFGLDAVVFSNAVFVRGDSNRRWSEPATIEISLDANHNGLADDAWYLIPGSHIIDAAAQIETATWDDDPADTTYPPNEEAWIPSGHSGSWVTLGYALPPEVFASVVVTNPGSGAGVEGIFGYAEYTPTLVLGDLDGDNLADDPGIPPEDFYTVPDNPFTMGITPGSGGGDAFDIAWAIDPTTGVPARLTGFDFLRLTTAVNVTDELTGTKEKSAEIDAAADVKPDPFGDLDDDGDIDLLDAAEFHVCFGSTAPSGPPCARGDRQPDGLIDGTDAAAMVRRMTGPLERRR